MTAGEGQGVKVFCPKCKTFVEIDSSTGIKLVKVEKKKKLEKGETPLDISLARLRAMSTEEISQLKRTFRELGLPTEPVEELVKNREDFLNPDNFNYELVSYKLIIPLKCGHVVSVEPYKIFDAFLTGHYAKYVLEYLKSKRPSPEDKKKIMIARFVANVTSISLIALYRYMAVKKRLKPSTEDLIEAFCEKLELDDKACNDVRRIVEESKARRGTS